MTGDEQHDATTEFNEALAAGFVAKNFDAIAPFYTVDASVTPPRGRALKGRDALPAFWLGLSNRFGGVSYTTTSLKDLGDAARRETGTYAMTGGEQPVEGHYLFVWQLVDGEWQIESALWNRSGENRGRGQGQGRPGAAGGGPRRAGGGGGGDGGYRGRPSFQGGGGGIGGGGQGGRGQGSHGGPGGGRRQGGGGGQGSGGLYDNEGGLYSNPKA